MSKIVIRTKNFETRKCPFCSFNGCCEHFEYSLHIENGTIWETHWKSLVTQKQLEERFIKIIKAGRNDCTGVGE